MRIWHGLDSIIVPFESSTLAIGVFDGIHLGHQKLLKSMVGDARRNDRRSAVLTFDRHPSELIAPDKAPGYLTSEVQRIRMFHSMGVDDLVIARFDERFRELSPEGFLRFVVCGVLGARSVFVGFDFRFGKNQAGDTGFLRSSPTRCDFEVTVLDPVLVEGVKAGSSHVRELIRSGDVEGAAHILGRHYAMSGTVVEGQKLGRQLGYPTANIEFLIPMVFPADGIYAVWVDVDEKRRMGACSIGFRPTVGGTTRTLEVYILDFEGNLYGTEIELHFVSRIRDEIKFESVDALVERIGEDVEQVRKLLSMEAYSGLAAGRSTASPGHT